ncbi:hypothetical protein K2173_021165 [Erythroxylum novogranatense]|uniref:Uncharacterized protein n=1 Tax=Erythroxylum novogranatense TaxID=1862640 RepID=A0AAV8TQF6_9ROSI|nr:hypothetical protein K2173_021165 [Erythroxylum novogranatense]
MKNSFRALVPADPKSKSRFCSFLVIATLICGTYFIGYELIGEEYQVKLAKWEVPGTLQSAKSNKCKNHCRPFGTDALPKGIIVKTSDFQMRSLWNNPTEDIKPNTSMNLLAIAVGMKQKIIVDQIVKKFPLSQFVVMLFHYDGIVDKWRDLSWSDSAIHISAMNQTKWWFAKRFLHPDIVADYDYIFLWDEDLGIENFDPTRYLSIVKDEGLEISQPALDPVKSEVHHVITARQRKYKVHRRVYKFKGHVRCNKNSNSPPCVGWVEMMAPVFSRAAWRCAWYMIQNDLVHAWGLDMQLGYCSQGDRTKNIGVVDSEYVVHLGLPTLGVFNQSKASPKAQIVDNRLEIRRQSGVEMAAFRKRWQKAAEEDRCWIDLFQ